MRRRAAKRRDGRAGSKRAENAMGDSRKILVIDDDAGIRRVMALALTDAGYTVVTAADGAAGVAMIARDEAPHIIITDIGMPGMNGLEVLKRIKEIDPDKEVVVTTAFSDIALAIKAMQLDAAGFVIKPVDVGVLASALKQAEERYARRKGMQDYANFLEERWMNTSEELAKTFHFQKMLIESSIDGIMACDAKGKIVIFNRAMEEILGYSREGIVGKNSLLDFFAPGEEGRFQDELYSEEGDGQNRVFPFLTELVDQKGERVPVVLSATVLFHGEDQIGIVAFCRKMKDSDRL